MSTPESEAVLQDLRSRRAQLQALATRLWPTGGDRDVQAELRSMLGAIRQADQAEQAINHEGNESMTDDIRQLDRADLEVMSPADIQAARERGQLDAVLGHAPISEDTEHVIEPDAETSPNAEAARYRTRLREAEGQRDQALSLVARLQRDTAERLIGERFSKPGDLFEIAGVKLDDLLTDDGLVDGERVDAALTAALKDRPGLAPPSSYRRAPNTNPAQGANGSRHPRDVEPADPWTDAFRPGGSRRDRR